MEGLEATGRAWFVIAGLFTCRGTWGLALPHRPGAALGTPVTVSSTCPLPLQGDELPFPYGLLAMAHAVKYQIRSPLSQV